MIIPLGGGGSKVVASIVVTYPAGSTLTCTLGSKVLTAKDTSGKWVFGLSSIGDWIVKATDGTDTATQTVTVTSGQTVNVTLSYWDGSIYDAGNEYTTHTGGWTCVATSDGALATKTNNVLSVSVNETSGVGYARTTNKVALTGFTKIDATITAQTHHSSWGGNERCSLLVSANTDLSNPVAYAKPTNNSAQILSLDINLTGSYYVGIKAGAGTASSVSMTVSKIQLV